MTETPQDPPSDDDNDIADIISRSLEGPGAEQNQEYQDQAGTAPTPLPHPMSADALADMSQNTISLVGFLRNHKDQSAEHLMENLMKLDRVLGQATETVRDEMRDARDANTLQAAIESVVVPAMINEAENLGTISNRAIQRLYQHDSDRQDLSSATVADIMLWLNICEKTRIATRLIFQVTHLYGRAPNGKAIASA